MGGRRAGLRRRRQVHPEGARRLRVSVTRCRSAHSSVWFRQSAGFSPRDRDQPFANFFFGGFGNNYVDHGDEKRYREYDSFAGAELNEIGGRNFVKSTVEWNLPPWRFARLGTPGFYATWLRPAIFVTGLATNLDDESVRRTLGNVGAQADIRISALSALDLTLSFGGGDRRSRTATRRDGSSWCR